MSKKKDKVKEVPTVDEGQPRCVIDNTTLTQLENTGVLGDDLKSGFQLADEFVGTLMRKVQECITVSETVKKIPEFNANLAVEMAYSCASMKAFAYDERADDYCLGLEDEPVST